MLENIPHPWPDSRRTPRIPLTSTGLFVLGFGYYRAYNGEPWFKRGDLEAAGEEANRLIQKDAGEETQPHVQETASEEMKRLRLPARWYYGEYIKRYVQLSLLHARASKPGEHGQSPRKYVSLSGAGANLLMESASYSLRHEGVDIPKLFPLPQVADAIKLDGKLIDYTARAMSGEPIALTINVLNQE